MRTSILVMLALTGCGSTSHETSALSPNSGAAAGAGSGAATSVGGAATGSSGATSSAGGGMTQPPVKVGDCGTLMPAGTWENLRSDWTDALVVDPFDPATIWLAQDSHGLLKSTDCGSTFTHISTGQNADGVNKGGIVSLAVDPVDRGVLYAAPIYGSGGLWKSVNGGVDWTQLFPAGSEGASVIGASTQIDSVSLDPTNHRHIVIGTHADCSGQYAPTCEAETLDAGATWRLFRSPPGITDASANWEEGGGPWVINATTWLYGALHLWLTTNNGADWKLLDPDPAQYYALNGGEVQTHSIPHASDGSYYLTTGQGIIRSTDEGLSWSLIPGGAQTVGFVIGNGKMYASNQWSANYYVADETNPMAWTDFPPPPTLAKDKGAPYLDYDSVHHILYSSNYGGGTWRVVTP